jgi:hypothetical protein
MIIWNDTLQQHDIRIKGNIRAKVDKYLGGDNYPNANVTAEQVETVVQNYVNPLIEADGYHLYIHIFSFPKKTQEGNPFEYVVWLGGIGDEPPVMPGNTYWWEPIIE